MGQRTVRHGIRLKNRPDFWVLFFTLAGFGLRVHRLSFQPLWGDEGWSIYFATQSVPQLLALTSVDIHPPLYYLLLNLWLLLAGLGPETARFFSVLAGTLLIPVAGVLGKQLGNWRLGGAAAAVTAVMPMAIYYSQEVRMYGLVTLLGAMSVYFFLNINTQARWRNTLPGYAPATTAALYTMYYAAFLVLAQLLYAVWIYLRKRGQRSLINTLKPFIVVGLLYLPWMAYAGVRLVNYIGNKRDVEGYLPLNLIRYLGDHLVAFSLGHLPPDFQPYVWVALPAVAMAAIGLWAARYLPHRRAGMLYLYLAVPFLAGYLVNQLYPFTPRFFERTLLLVAPAFWLLIAVGLVWLWERQYLLVGTVAAAMLVPIVVSLIAFYVTPRYPDEDYRPLLRELAARATPEDTVLASYQWQLGFYRAYLPRPRPTLFAVPGWGAGWSAAATESPQLTGDLTAIFNQSPRLWFPAYQAGGHIWEDEAEAAIARLGYPALLTWYSPQTKLTLAGASQTPVAEFSAANFENRLTLLAATVGGKSFQAGRDIVPVEMQWRKEANLGRGHQVSLRLVDAAGRTWATRDSHPLAGQTRFTDMKIGDTLTDRHGLLTPAGAPPGTYRLLLSIRRLNDAHPLDLVDEAGQPLGAELPLGKIVLTAPQPPVGTAALPVQTVTGADFGEQAQLVGYSLGDESYKSGEILPLTLFWESRVDFPGPLTVVIQLQDAAGQTVFSYSHPPIWPATEWQQGTIVRDPHDVLLPAAFSPGRYRLVVALEDAAQNRLPVNGESILPLQMVTTLNRPRRFDAPATQFQLDKNFGDRARLVGLDLPSATVNAGQHLPLTLHWQAIRPADKSWSVFVHLTDKQGNLVSQQDQLPGGGQFPTTGWASDEYLADSYNLRIPADTPPGRQCCVLNVGFYDTNDFSRLPVLEDGEIVGDHVTLKSWPISIE